MGHSDILKATYSVFHKTKPRSPFFVNGEPTFVSWNALYMENLMLSVKCRWSFLKGGQSGEIMDFVCDDPPLFLL